MKRKYTNYRKIFGAFIKILRIKYKIKRVTLAQKVGIKPDYLYQIEKGNMSAPPPHILDKLAQVLELKEVEYRIFYNLACVSLFYSTFLNKGMDIDYLISHFNISKIKEDIYSFKHLI